MKNLIDLTNEDAQKVVDAIQLLTQNRFEMRRGSNGLEFNESFKKYGSAYIEFSLLSQDIVTDGHFTYESKFRIVFHHNSVWFSGFDSDGEPSNYNKNHLFGYLKLQELGYKLPEKAQWT